VFGEEEGAFEMPDRLCFVIQDKKSLPEQCIMSTFIETTFCGEHKYHIYASFCC
jgi:hypothetical protein